MELEWDEEKRARTLRERGLDFAELAAFDWDDARIEPDERKAYGESRYRAYGQLGGRMVRVVFTDRGARRRIISLHLIREGRS
jgi:uncharacterized DUF497 family protein